MSPFQRWNEQEKGGNRYSSVGSIDEVVAMFRSKVGRRTVILGGVGAIASVLMLPRPSSAAQTLRFVATGNFPPFNMRGEGETIIGLYADLLKEIGSLTNIKFEYRPYPWVRAQKMVEDGDADGFITIPTEARRAYALFVDSPVFSTGGPVLVSLKTNKDADAIKSAKSLEDLKKFRIGDYRGNSIGNAIHKDWTDKQIVGDISGLLKILVAERIDYTIQNEFVVKYYAKAEGLLQNLEFTKLPFSVTEKQDYHIGIRRSLPDAANLIAEIDKAQDKLEKNGILDRITQSYIS